VNDFIHLLDGKVQGKEYRKRKGSGEEVQSLSLMVTR